MSKRRVVVTGLGMLSPLGNDVETTWKNILAGKSGVNLIENFDTTQHTTKFAAQVKDFDASEFIPRKETKKMDLFIQYGIVAGEQAIRDSGLNFDKEDRSRIGIAVGSGIGGIGLIETNTNNLAKFGPRKVSPFFVPSTIINMAAGHISINHQLYGPNISISTACTSGVHNIGHAARMISYGDADVMIAGSAEKASTSLGIAGFGALRALSTRNDSPEKASRPWDINRDGFVLGDGAGILVLEEYEHAKARGAKIYAEIIGFGMSADGHHMTSPPEDGAGAALAMQNAIKDANIEAQQIGYINAHGTSTPVGDIAEATAITNVMGEHKNKVLVSSTKSMTGHLLGAAGAIESIFTILALRDQVAPPTINLDEQDPKVTLDLVANKSRPAELEYALNNSFGFGGTNGSIIFRKI